LTINSLFYNINTCEVEDFTEKGLDDLLEHKMIRTPLPPSETFRDGRLEPKPAVINPASTLCKQNACTSRVPAGWRYIDDHRVKR